MRKTEEQKRQLRKAWRKAYDAKRRPLKPRSKWLKVGATKGRPKPLGSGRKQKPPHASATPEEIRLLAADGHSIKGIASRFGTTFETFTRWLDEDNTLREAFEVGRENERHALHNMLYRQALEKNNIVAAMFLLKARHGYREGDQGDTGNKVSIVFQLPGAMQMQEFKNLEKVVIENEPSNSTKRLSK